MTSSCRSLHHDVIKWRHFPRYWPFERRIHRSPVNSQHKVQWRGALMFFFYLNPNKRLSKQSRGWWFETPSRPLWRHRNAIFLLTRFPLDMTNCDSPDSNWITLAHITIFCFASNQPSSSCIGVAISWCYYIKYDLQRVSNGCMSVLFPDRTNMIVPRKI